MAQWHKALLQTRLVVSSIPTRGSEVLIYIYIFISSLWYRSKKRTIEFGGSECLNTRFPLPTLPPLPTIPAVCGIQREAVFFLCMLQNCTKTNNPYYYRLYQYIL